MPYANVVIDLSHFNGSPDLRQGQPAGVLGVLHKAAQGSSFADPRYAARRQECGLLQAVRTSRCANTVHGSAAFQEGR